MTDLTVRGRFEGDAKGLVGAAKASQDEIRKVGQAADAASTKVGDLGGKSGARGAAGAAEDVKKLREELERSLGSADRSYGAVRRITDAQAQLATAHRRGAISTQEFNAHSAVLAGRLDAVQDRVAKQALSLDVLATGQVKVGQVMRLGTEYVKNFAAGMIGGALASGVMGLAMTAVEFAVKGLAAAWRDLTTDEQIARFERLRAALDKVGAKLREVTVESNVARGNQDALTRKVVEDEQKKIDKEIEFAERRKQVAKRQNEPEEFANLDRYIQGLRARRASLETEVGVIQNTLDDIFNRGGTVRYPFARGKPGDVQGGPGQPKTGGSNPLADLLKGLREENAKATAQLGGSGSVGAAYAELELKLKSLKATTTQATEAKRLFFDTLEAKGKTALKAYGEETEKQRQILAAEIAGRRELIPLIELEFQLREQYGQKFVERNRGMLTAMAAERAAVQRQREQWQATTQFIEGSADQVGNAIGAGLVLPLDESADRLKNYLKLWQSTVTQIVAELNRLAVVNPILNALAGGNRPTAYGQGGLLSFLFGSRGDTVPIDTEGLGNVDLFHGGGIVGDRAASRVVDLAAWRNAKRYHGGGFAGDEVPIIARRGEPIFTPRGMENADNLVRALMAMAANDSGSGITIIDQRGAGAPPIETRRRRGAGGRLETLAIVKKDAQQAFNDGAFDTIMAQRYGLAVRGKGG